MSALLYSRLVVVMQMLLLTVTIIRLCEVQPLISHDHTEIRRSALVNIAKREGLEYDQSIIEDAIHVRKYTLRAIVVFGS